MSIRHVYHPITSDMRVILLKVHVFCKSNVGDRRSHGIAPRQINVYQELIGVSSKDNSDGSLKHKTIAGVAVIFN